MIIRKEDEGTLDYNIRWKIKDHIEDSLYLSHKEEEEEEYAPYFQEDSKKSFAKM